MNDANTDYNAQQYWEYLREDVYRQDSHPIFSSEKMSIHINTDEVEGKEYVNYFKVFNAKRWCDATKVNRISFVQPIYICKENRDGCVDWILNAEEKKRLVEILQSVHHSGSISNFEAARRWCNEMNRVGEPMPKDIPMPDYTQLPEE